jgi:UDP-N-acetylglucosamine acyltransferase
MKNVSIGKNVQIGKDVILHEGVIISDNVSIGDNTEIFPYAVVGTPAETTSQRNKNGKTIIGKNCTIREFVTINASHEDEATVVGDGCYLMSKSHLGHDVILNNNVVICTGAKIGGHTVIGQYSYVGLNATTHQRSKLGAYCIIGASSLYKSTDDISGITWVGLPSKPIKINMHNINKNIKDEEQKNIIINKAQNYITKFI